MTKTANVTRNSLVTYGLWGAITSSVIGQMEGLERWERQPIPPAKIKDWDAPEAGRAFPPWLEDDVINLQCP